MSSVARPRIPAASKFVVGQRVEFSPGSFSPRTPVSSRFTVMRVLPVDDGRRSYRIKSDSETFERVAQEGQLALPTLD